MLISLCVLPVLSSLLTSLTVFTEWWLCSRNVVSGYIIIIIIIKGHSLQRACLQPATNTQNSKPRPPTCMRLGGD